MVWHWCPGTIAWRADDPPSIARALVVGFVQIRWAYLEGVPLCGLWFTLKGLFSSPKLQNGLATFFEVDILYFQIKKSPKCSLHHMASNTSNCLSFWGSSPTQLRSLRRSPYLGAYCLRVTGNNSVKRNLCRTYRACSYPTETFESTSFLVTPSLLYWRQEEFLYGMGKV